MKLITSTEFDKVTSGTDTCVVFSATWCGPCKTLAKTLVENAEHLSVPFYKMDINDDPTIAQKNQVKSVPTIIFFRDGAEVNRVIGMRSFAQLQEFIKGAQND